ncbi:MAG TPA: CAP domain-containing protein [Nocardioides sp.]|nr:CAP domain-containing protein [Nocardioides sp.]
MNRGIQKFVIAAVVVLAAAVAPTATPAATASTTASTTAVRSVSLTLTVNSILENSVVLLTNTQRVLAGCRPLKANFYLRRAARIHSKRMALANTMSHQLPGELSLGRRITRAGYVGWTRVAENIAAGYTTAGTATRAWWASPSHHRNIADCSLREIGVGVVFNGLRMYWTVDFGRR